MGRLVFVVALIAGCASPQPPAKAAPYDRSCQSDAECAPAPGCCPAPCTQLVINVKELPRAKAELRCDPQQVCPSAGSCVTHQYLCVRNECRLVYEGDPGYRDRTP
jgi:hypothetical protein